MRVLKGNESLVIIARDERERERGGGSNEFQGRGGR
jgi:hypothetical protein